MFQSHLVLGWKKSGEVETSVPCRLKPIAFRRCSAAIRLCRQLAKLLLGTSRRKLCNEWIPNIWVNALENIN